MVLSRPSLGYLLILGLIAYGAVWAEVDEEPSSGNVKQGVLNRLVLSEGDSTYLMNKLLSLQNKLVRPNPGQPDGGSNLEDILSNSVEEELIRGKPAGHQNPFSYRAYPFFKKTNTQPNIPPNLPNVQGPGSLDGAATNQGADGEFGAILRSLSGSVMTAGGGEPPREVYRGVVPGAVGASARAAYKLRSSAPGGGEDSALPGHFIDRPLPQRNLGVAASQTSTQNGAAASLSDVEGKLMETLRQAKSNGINIQDILTDLNKQGVGAAGGSDAAPKTSTNKRTVMESRSVDDVIM